MRLTKEYSLETVLDHIILMPSPEGMIRGKAVFTLGATGAWIAQQLQQDISYEELRKRAAAQFNFQLNDPELLQGLEQNLVFFRTNGVLEE